MAGEHLSLNEIEHRILRGCWGDRRIHYGVDCGALGCPDLLPTAYRGVDVDRVLDAAEQAFVNDPRGVTFRRGKLIVNSIYVWYPDDFQVPGGTIIDYLRAHARTELATRLAEYHKPDGHAYDWALNAAG